MWACRVITTFAVAPATAFTARPTRVASCADGHTSIAQLEEQQTFNLRVAGSRPAGGTNLRMVPRRAGLRPSAFGGCSSEEEAAVRRVHPVRMVSALASSGRRFESGQPSLK